MAAHSKTKRLQFKEVALKWGDCCSWSPSGARSSSGTRPSPGKRTPGTCSSSISGTQSPSRTRTRPTSGTETRLSSGVATRSPSGTEMSSPKQETSTFKSRGVKSYTMQEVLSQVTGASPAKATRNSKLRLRSSEKLVMSLDPCVQDGLSAFVSTSQLRNGRSRASAKQQGIETASPCTRRKRAEESSETEEEEEKEEEPAITSPRNGGSRLKRPDSKEGTRQSDLFSEESQEKCSTVLSTSKKRGRQPRKVYSAQENRAGSIPSPRMRGRPKKIDFEEENSNNVDDSGEESDVLAPSPRKLKGRSKKIEEKSKNADLHQGSGEESVVCDVIGSSPRKLKRRPKKIGLEEEKSKNADREESDVIVPSPRKLRKRPKKTDFEEQRGAPSSPHKRSARFANTSTLSTPLKKSDSVANIVTPKKWKDRDSKQEVKSTSSRRKRMHQDEDSVADSAITSSRRERLRPRKMCMGQDLSVYDFLESDDEHFPRSRKSWAPNSPIRKWQKEEEEEEEDSSYDSSEVSSEESSSEEARATVHTKAHGRRKVDTKSSGSKLKKVEEDSLVDATPRKSRKRKEVILDIPDRDLAPPRKKSKKGKQSKFDSVREREEEFKSIYDFVQEKLLACKGGCMYISGLPGTGKTATVLEVTRSLREAAEEGDLPHFILVEVNGMRLTEPKQVFVSVLEQLTGERKSPDAAQVALHTYFSSSKKKTPTVLFADELDLLSTRKQRVLYELMSWPNLNNSRLVLLGVANTMNLPERINENKKLSTRMGNSRIKFAPYTHQQLQKILTARVCGLKLFEPDVIELAVRKVAALSGDIRRALDLLIRSVEIAQGSEQREVKIPHLQQAIEEMFSSSMMRAVKHCSLYQKLLLRAILAEFQRSGVEEAVFWRIIDCIQELYHLEGVKPIAPSLVSRLCTGLCVSRILLVDDPGKDLDRKIRLNLPPNDLKLALFS